MSKRSNCRITWAKITGKEQFCTGCSEALVDLEEDGDETEIHRTQSFVHKIGDSETTICFDEDGDLIDLDAQRLRAAEGVRRGERDLERAADEEAAEHRVVHVAVLRLAHVRV